ncbi:MAG TPA: hypothetical protein DDW42_07175 [Desulfobacteraceae bacterium]|nr:hypothetical protein [Desulfobacteraceae bacterium]
MNESIEFDVKTSIVDSVTDLFDTMLSMEVKSSEETQPPSLEGQRITGSLGFAGDVEGSINIQVTNNFAQLMAASMLGMEMEEIETDEEINDVILEVCNIIGGKLKSSLHDAGLNCLISAPSITIGNDFKIETLRMDRYESVSFRCQDHIFFVEVCLKTADEVAPEYEVQLKSIDINQFKRIDIISTSGDSIIELFDTMLSMEVERTDKTAQSSFDNLVITGVINFAGDVRGNISIQLDYAFARSSTEAMMNKKLDEIEGEEEIKGLVGKMSNIIGGNLKAGFCDSGLNCKISPPSITVGKDFTTKVPNMDRYERFAFCYNEYDIFVEVCVKIDEDTQTQEHAESKTDDVVDNDTLEAEGRENPRDDHSVNDEPEAENQLKPKDNAPKDNGSYNNLDSVLGIPIEITVELGRGKMEIGELLELGHGSNITLSSLEGETLDILVNKKLVARGEVVVDKEKYGIRITEMVSRMDRIKSLQ